MDRQGVLGLIDTLPILEWNYQTDSDEVRHLGPIAEDFYALFGLGHDEQRLAPGDVAGVALAGIQGLLEIVETQAEQIESYYRLAGLIPDSSSPGDVLTGDAGVNTFTVANLTDSLLGSSDIITNLEIGTDNIDGPNAVAANDVAQLGDAVILAEIAIHEVLTPENFVAHGAASFTVGNQTFLALNNGVPGYSAPDDAIVEITDFSGSLSDLAIV